MNQPRRDDDPDWQVVQSLVGRALLRVHRALRESAEREARVEELLAAWHRQWEQSRQRVEHRLQAIERQLEARESHAADALPRFTVVGGPPESPVARSRSA